MNCLTWWDENVVSGKQYTVEQFRRILSRNERKLYKANSMLDIGCGPGLEYEFQQENNSSLKYFGLDICRGFIKYNKLKHPKGNFMVGAGDNLPFREKSIGIVVIRHVLEHVKKPIKILQEAFRVSDNALITWFLAPGDKEKIIKKDGFYKNTYLKDKIQEDIRKIGYKSIEIQRHYKNEIWLLTF